MLRSLLAIALLLLNVVFCLGQQVRPVKSSDIYGELKTFKNLSRVLYLAAHPDDENTGLLAYFVHEKNLETAYLSLTRGDGGQNLLGNEQGAALGLIRTFELLEARKLDGAQQFFTRAIDFGFSKNTNDTFKQWNADSLTSDVVWVIRKFRPDIIICRFPPTAAAGHGQHAASAVVAEKAFKAAGNPGQFPNQLKYVSTWQPKQLLWNTFRFGNTNTTAENQLKITMGQYDPLQGMGYGELAGISRSLHKSQGAGTPSVAGIRTEYFAQVAGQPLGKDLSGELNKTFGTVGYPGIDKALDLIVKNFDFQAPDRSLPGLIELRKQLINIKDQNLRTHKLQALDKLILHCSGFMAELVTGTPTAVAGSTLPFKLNLIARSVVPVSLQSLSWPGSTEKIYKILTGDSLITLNQHIRIPANAPLTEPYWLAKPPLNAATFSVASDTLIGLPGAEPFLQARLSLKIGEVAMDIQLPLSYKKLDPVKGDVVEPLRLVPVVELKFNQLVYLARSDGGLKVDLQFKINTDQAFKNGTVTFTSGGQVLASFSDVSLQSGEQTRSFTLTKKQLDPLHANQFKLEAGFNSNGVVYDKSQQLIQYPHLPTLQYFAPATTQVIKGDIRVTAQKIAYLEGAGDLIPAFLRQSGLQVDVLKAADVQDASKLATYDALVTGVRVVNVEKQLPAWLPALKNYVKNGGTLIMQYNTQQDMTTNDFGVYPFSLSNKRVTEEDAEVVFLNPAHRLLNEPNKITAADFKGWVQERGTYFPDNWDQRYEPLFEMHDTGEEPLKGATLYAKYGKGHFIYTSLAFFRQLPAGNAGAARLFFNFLSAGK